MFREMKSSTTDKKKRTVFHNEEVNKELTSISSTFNYLFITNKSNRNLFAITIPCNERRIFDGKVSTNTRGF